MPAAAREAVRGLLPNSPRVPLRDVRDLAAGPYQAVVVDAERKPAVDGAEREAGPPRAVLVWCESDEAAMRLRWLAGRDWLLNAREGATGLR